MAFFARTLTFWRDTPSTSAMASRTRGSVASRTIPTRASRRRAFSSCVASSLAVGLRSASRFFALVSSILAMRASANSAISSAVKSVSSPWSIASTFWKKSFWVSFGVFSVVVVADIVLLPFWALPNKIFCSFFILHIYYTLNFGKLQIFLIPYFQSASSASHIYMASSI